MENRVNITYNKLAHVSLVRLIVRFYPIFTEFLENAKNLDKDWIWQVRMYSTYKMNTQIIPRFSRVDSTNGKSEWKLIMKG